MPHLRIFLQIIVIILYFWAVKIWLEPSRGRHLLWLWFVDFYAMRPWEHFGNYCQNLELDHWIKGQLRNESDVIIFFALMTLLKSLRTIIMDFAKTCKNNIYLSLCLLFAMSNVVTSESSLHFQIWCVCSLCFSAHKVTHMCVMCVMCVICVHPVHGHSVLRMCSRCAVCGAEGGGAWTPTLDTPHTLSTLSHLHLHGLQGRILGKCWVSIYLTWNMGIIKSDPVDSCLNQCLKSEPYIY